MSPLIDSRNNLMDARVALWDADLAFAQGDLRGAAIKLDLARAFTEEARKLLAVAGSAPTAPEKPEEPRPL
jgi:hypothetical protein